MDSINCRNIDGRSTVIGLFFRFYFPPIFVVGFVVAVSSCSFLFQLLPHETQHCEEVRKSINQKPEKHYSS